MGELRGGALDLVLDDEPGEAVNFALNGPSIREDGKLLLPINIAGYPAVAELAIEHDTGINQVSGEPTSVWHLFREEARFGSQYDPTNMSCRIQFAPVKVYLVERPFPASISPNCAQASDDALLGLLASDFRREFSPDLVLGSTDTQREFATLLDIATLYTRQQFGYSGSDELASLPHDEAHLAFTLTSFDTRLETYSYQNVRSSESRIGLTPILSNSAHLFSVILKVLKPRLTLTYAYVNHRGVLQTVITFALAASFLAPYEAQNFHDRVEYANRLRAFLLKHNAVTGMDGEKADALLSGIDEEVAPVCPACDTFRTTKPAARPNGWLGQ